MMDATGLYAARELVDTLVERGIVVAIAGRQMEWRRWAESHGFTPEPRRTRTFPTLRRAVRAFREEEQIGHSAQQAGALEARGEA